MKKYKNLTHREWELRRRALILDGLDSEKIREVLGEQPPGKTGLNADERKSLVDAGKVLREAQKRAKQRDWAKNRKSIQEICETARSRRERTQESCEPFGPTTARAPDILNDARAWLTDQGIWCEEVELFFKKDSPPFEPINLGPEERKKLKAEEIIGPITLVEYATEVLGRSDPQDEVYRNCVLVYNGVKMLEPGISVNAALEYSALFWIMLDRINNKWDHHLRSVRGGLGKEDRHIGHEIMRDRLRFANETYETFDQEDVFYVIPGLDSKEGILKVDDLIAWREHDEIKGPKDRFFVQIGDDESTRRDWALRTFVEWIKKEQRNEL